MFVSDSDVVLITLILALIGVIATKTITAVRARRRLLAGLAEHWGQPSRRNREHRPVAARTPSKPVPGAAFLDRVTWSDLGIAQVFTRIDRTLTSVGAQRLHAMLRCPLIELEAIERRRALVVAVAADPERRVAMQRALLDLGDKHGWQAWHVLGGTLPMLPGPVWLLRLLPLALLGALAAAIMLDNLLLFIVAVALGIALPLIHMLSNRYIGHHLDAVADMRRVLDTAVSLHDAASPEVRELVDDILGRVKPLRRAFGKRASAPVDSGRFGGGPELAAEYGKAFLLTELVPYQQATRAIARHRADYERVLDVVGEIDAALSIAHLRAHDAELRDAIIDPAAPGLEAKDLCHPLVDDPVGNDVQLASKGLLVTGSNMAGKSTLLRTIGVNVVLAQSIGRVAAQSWCSRPLHVATAMGAHDDLAAGVSLYRAEVDRIHALVERAGGDHLFVLDEAFRGTNPHERIAASAAVLRHLGRRDLVVAATHDRELCELLEDCFTLGFFTEAVEGDDVIFDYRLRPGVLQTTNAIALLERAGFPAELVAEARRLASEH
jgi:hypothetical protein